MNLMLRKCLGKAINHTRRNFSTTNPAQRSYCCKLLIVGGGSGGCAIAAKFVKKLGRGSIIVLDPSDRHYYQPLFTLVGSGRKPFNASHRNMAQTLPSGATYLRDACREFAPQDNMVITESGDEIGYEFMVIAVGIENKYHKIPGLKEALDAPGSGVSTIYSPDYVQKTWNDLSKIECGDCYFTMPQGPIKCAGAPQKIAYMADSIFRTRGVRKEMTLTYNTALPVIFGVKKYADVLWIVAEDRDINVNTSMVLTEIYPECAKATFERTTDNSIVSVSYHLLHVTPPQGTPDSLACNECLVDVNGYLDVDKYTLQHTRYDNVFGIGDCTNTPNSKTAAAVAKQSEVVEKNLMLVMEGREASEQYNGYAACPIVTGIGTCILAEFDYMLQPLETLPFDQGKESRVAYQVNKEILPIVYWNMFTKGMWNGPGIIRKLINPFGWN